MVLSHEASCYGSSVGTLNLSSMFREIPKYSCHQHCHIWQHASEDTLTTQDSVYALLHTLTRFVYSKITLVSFCLFNSKITATLPKKYLSLLSMIQTDVTQNVSSLRLYIHTMIP